MKFRINSIVAIFLVVIVVGGCTKTESTSNDRQTDFYKPWEELGVLYHDIMMAGIFPDSKTFADCTPVKDPADLLSDYMQQKDDPGFDLETFTKAGFKLPYQPEAVEVDVSVPMIEHLNEHWDNLTRESDDGSDYSTLIPLPNKYVVPGGRFREVYYWDSYFTMIGLGVSGRIDLMESMLDNFAYEINTIGFIPNGNRTYYLGRSQPPFFAAMVNLYAQYPSPEQAAEKYLNAIQKEYDFWMEGSGSLTDTNPAHRRVVKIGDHVFNRYYDDIHLPRPESYKEDYELAEELSEGEKDELYLNLRAAAESGWDFSARWFADLDDFSTIRTTEIAPVDLNSLIYNMELVLAKLYDANGNQAQSKTYQQLAQERRAAFNEVFWNSKEKVFMDVLWADGAHTGHITAASFYPMYFHVAMEDKGQAQVDVLIDKLLADGGLLTTTFHSGQQWDYPNGWAPLQWIAYKGLVHYDASIPANLIRDRWMSLNKKVYENTGKMMEKYNVADITLSGGGGEYPNQDGFGWTNGVALGMDALTDKY